jgi:hypothetical protein
MGADHSLGDVSNIPSISSFSSYLIQSFTVSSVYPAHLSAEWANEVNRGDLVQASEKFWGASVLAVKRIAATRGLKLEKHGAVWAFVSRLGERNDNELILLLHAAQGLHRNFYENELDRKAVEITAERVELLIEKLREI